MENRYFDVLAAANDPAVRVGVLTDRDVVCPGMDVSRLARSRQAGEHRLAARSRRDCSASR